MPPSQDFTWTAGVGVQKYWLDVGTSVGIGNISAGEVTETHKVVSGLPAGGGPLWVRLWSSINGVWQSPLDYSFVARP